MHRLCIVVALLVTSSLASATPASAAIDCGPFVQTAYGPVQVRAIAGIPSQFLDITAWVEPDVQLQSQWRWAAAISGVFAYYGHPVSQARSYSKPTAAW